MRNKNTPPSERYYTVDAGWPHVALFARSGALTPDETGHFCFIRAGLHVYFAIDNTHVEEEGREQFDLTKIKHFPSRILEEKPLDTLGNVDRYLLTTPERK